MCDLHSKFEEDWTKTAVAIVDGQTDRQTDRQTYSQVVVFVSNATH